MPPQEKPYAARRTLTVRRTVAPSRASISISASVLKRSIRPRSRSVTRGCVTPECLGGSPLLKTTRRNELLYLNHEIGPDQQMFGLLTAKPKVTEYVPVDGVIFGFIHPMNPEWGHAFSWHTQWLREAHHRAAQENLYLCADCTETHSEVQLTRPLTIRM